MAQSNSTDKRIDAHQHFWSLERDDYDWLTPELISLYKDYLPADLSSILKSENISQTVLIQAAETDHETDFLLDLARQTKFVAGVVGWIDLSSKHAIHRLQSLAKEPYFKGIRPMIQDIPDDNWMLRPEFGPVYEALIAEDLCFDALVKPRHLNALYELLQRHPKLKVVIDHGAKPDIEHNETEEWSAQIARIAKETNAYCKLSGLTAEAEVNANSETLIPYIEHLVASFGPNRIMWGSDWPVLNLSSTYDNWVQVCESYLSRLDSAAQTAIWSQTAETFYSL